MNRAGYTEDSEDQWAMIRWRGAVASSIRGKRGQAFLRELLAALDAMPEKRLIQGSFSQEGAYCTLGVIGASRGAEMPVIDPDEEWPELDDVRGDAAAALKIPEALAGEIMYYNDECGNWKGDETPETRWTRMRAWVDKQISPEAQP